MVLNNLSRFLAFEEIPESERSYEKRLADFGQVLLGKDQFEPALERFNTAIRDQPTYIAAWLGRAQALRGLNRYALALQSLCCAEALMPKPQAGLLLDKAELWVKLKKLDLALEACEASLSLAPHQFRARSLRLVLLWRLGAPFQVWSGLDRLSLSSVQDESMAGLIPLVAPAE